MNESVHEVTQPTPEALAETAAAIIRDRSAHGQFTTDEEIRDELEARDLLGSGAESSPDLPQILAMARERHADLRELPGPEGRRRFFSTESMTEAYANLLLKKEGDPLELMVAIIRENSALYPRPFPLGGFERLPFGLERDEILECPSRMAALPAYQDIAQTCTSAQHVYLYSRHHLDPAYASSLAEWYDVGQSQSP